MNYIIKNHLLKVTISDIGAEIKSINYLGEERLHDSNPIYWNRSAPILFPNIGKLINNETKINNQIYPLPKHGFLRDLPLKVLNQSDDDIVFQLTDNQDTWKVYPFHFEITIKYHLENNQLQSYIIVKNISTTDTMPFNLGLHPAFKVPFNDNESFSDYSIEFPETTTYHIPSVDLSTGTIDNQNTRIQTIKEIPLNYHDYQNDAIILDPFSFDQVVLSSPNNQKIIFKFNNFPTLGIWTPNNIQANFICIEPWHGCADLTNHDGYFEHKKDLIFLKPSDTKLFSYSFTFEN